MKLCVLIPAYHEEHTIGVVLEQLLRFDATGHGVEMEIVVCDDGSMDGTAHEVRLAQGRSGNIRLVNHERNRGKGAAIRTGLTHVRSDYVLIQDADLEYGVQDYPALIAAARAGAPVVYGSRFLSGRYPRGMHPANFIANKVLTWCANALFGHSITDEATCLKLFPTELLRSLHLRCERFEFCPEVTAKLGRLRIPIVEVAVDYRARRASQGKKVRWFDGVHALAVLFRERCGPGPRLLAAQKALTVGAQLAGRQ